MINPRGGSPRKMQSQFWADAIPPIQGLYDPDYEKDACGVGFICHIKGDKRHDLVRDARGILCNMTHRGATGADLRDGDGAGLMSSIPHLFFKKHAETLNITLPPVGEYAVGNLFFNPNENIRNESINQFEEIARDLGLLVLFWRTVPVQSSILGPVSRSKEPVIMQPYIVMANSQLKSDTQSNTFTAAKTSFDVLLFERQLYVLRKNATRTIGLKKWFYICSLSTKNIVYKGQLSPVQVYEYFDDLRNLDYKSHFCLVHSRFSTNTFPSWDRAQPMRWCAHNGEINTLRGNKNWMRAREGVIISSYPQRTF